MTKKISIYTLLSIFIICLLAIGTTYARFTLKKEISGTITVPEDNYCINNGFTKLSDCMLIMDNASDSVETARTTIKNKTYDTNKTEPVIIYRKVETLGLTGTNLTSTSNAIYFTEEEPTFNSSTGFYTWTSSTAKLGLIPDYISDADKKYYTCMNQTSNGNCTTVYAIYNYSSTVSNGVTTYRVTEADRYTQKVTDTASSTPGLYYTVDDYGDSYFYRGNVTNNYVYYAGFIWRIIRMNGDGSIRLIYSGTSTSATGSQTTIGSSAYNSERQDMAFVGYKYGLNQVLKHKTNTLTYTNISASTTYYYSDSYECDDTTKKCKLTGNVISGTWQASHEAILSGNDENGNVPYKYTCWGTASTTSCPIVSEITATVSLGTGIHPTQARVKYHGYLSATYADTYSDTNDSTIKQKIDPWYENNILNKKDENGNSYASYLSDTLFCNDRSISPVANSGDGETLERTTLYGAYYRNVNNKTPNLVCPREEDKFTVSNGKLSYPIALITIDEVALAGGRNGSMNSLYYLYTGQTYWTMSPYYFNSNYASARVWFVRSTGDLGSNWSTLGYGVRPVINLSSDILISGGTGTANNPYVVTK